MCVGELCLEVSCTWCLLLVMTKGSPNHTLTSLSVS